jgi:hypothetical protein
VLFYGFDDLSVLQRDAIAALAATDAEVTASLTYEPGRHAFAARGETVEALRPVAAEVVALLPNAEHYAPESRAALHALERGLFEEGSLAAAAAAPCSTRRRRRSRQTGELTLFDDLAARALGAEADPPGVIRASRAQDADDEARAGAAAAGDAIVFLEGGGERAELELVAAEVARLIRDEGVEPEEIAVVLRQPDEAAALLGQVFDAYGIPLALTRSAKLGHTPLGRGLVALLRAATGGTAATCSAGCARRGACAPRTASTASRPTSAGPARGPPRRPARCGRPSTPTRRSAPSTGSPTPRGAGRPSCSIA